MTEDQPVFDLPHHEASTSSLVLDAHSFSQVMAFAEVMATGRATIPQHLRNSPADCMAVIMQSMQWGMNPFAVSQKTHLSQSGALGYESQLVNAVVITRAPIEHRPDFEFIGDWSKILGKVKEMKSDKGGKYYVADWNKPDEDGLGVICRCTIRGEAKPREVMVMMSQAYPRFSTQWATDPQQQITYLAIRKWARRYTPDVLLGVYTPEELAGIGAQSSERDITPRTPAEFGAAALPQAGASIDRNTLIRDLEHVARSKGPEPFKAAWKALTVDEKAAIGIPERDRIKMLADMAVAPEPDPEDAPTADGQQAATE
jgi:hypothetical protein